jgi:hypothetical protein
MFTITNDKKTKDLFKKFYEEIRNIKYDVNYNEKIFDSGWYLDCSKSKCIQYILFNEVTNEKIIGNLLFILSNIDNIIDKSNFDYKMTDLYGILERYEIIKNIKKINGVRIYDFKKIYDVVSNNNFDVNINLNNKLLEVNSLEFEKHNIIGFNDFYEYIGTYFDLWGVNCFNLYFKNTQQENYVKPKPITKLQSVINQSKKDNYCNIEIRV